MYHNYHSTNSGEHGAKCCRSADHSILVCAREKCAQVRQQWAHTSSLDRSNARLTNATLRARRGVGLLRDAFGDAGAAVLELHGRVQRRLKCRPTLERACVGRSTQGTGGCGWLNAEIVGGGSPAGALTMAGLTGRSEHCCVGMVERRSPCRHARAYVVIEPRAAGWAVCTCVQWAYRQSAWATRRGRAVGGGCRWLADVWCTFL